MKKALILVLLSIPVVAMSDTDNWYANMHIGSSHSAETYESASTGKDLPLNEKNTGFGIEYSINDNLSIKAGTFKNSTDNQTNYIGVNTHTSYSRLFAVGINIGAATGYEDFIISDNETIVPFILPALYINVGNVKTEIGMFPALGDGMPAIITVSVGNGF